MQPELQPIIEEPALLVKEKKILVIADLHIGIESELHESGLQVPSQTKLMEQRLISILTTYDVDDIVLLGDIKHTIPSSTFQERTDVKNFLNIICSFGTLHVLPGNHEATSIGSSHPAYSCILPMDLCLMISALHMDIEEHLLKSCPVTMSSSVIPTQR